MQIIPMKDLKDTAAIERLCAEEQGPVYITKNGYGRLVVMDIDVYEKTIRQIYEAKLLSAGLQDLEAGHVLGGPEATAALRKKHGL